MILWLSNTHKNEYEKKKNKKRKTCLDQNMAKIECPLNQEKCAKFFLHYFCTHTQTNTHVEYVQLTHTHTHTKQEHIENIFSRLFGA